MVQYCACCARCGKGADREEPETTTQFIREEGSYGANAFGMTPETDKHKRGCNSTRIIQVLIMILALATAGLAAWGIATSVESTDNQVTAFWALVDSVDDKVTNTTTKLKAVSDQVTELQTNIQVIQDDPNGEHCSLLFPLIFLEGLL